MVATWPCLAFQAKAMVKSFRTDWVTDPFPSTTLHRRHAQTVTDWSSSHKIDYVRVIKNFPEGHQNPISCSKVTGILLKGWILPVGGVASGRVCACSLRSRLVYEERQKPDTLAVIDNHNFFDRHTYIRIRRLYDRPGPEGPVGENVLTASSCVSNLGQIFW